MNFKRNRMIIGLLLLLMASPSYAFPVFLSAGSSFLVPIIGLFVSGAGALSKRKRALRVFFLAIFALLFVHMQLVHEATLRNGMIKKFDSQLFIESKEGLEIRTVDVDLSRVPAQDFFDVTKSMRTYYDDENIIGYKSNKIKERLEENPGGSVLLSGDVIAIHHALRRVPEELRGRIFYLNPESLKSQIDESSKGVELKLEPFLRNLPPLKERLSNTVGVNGDGYNIVMIENHYSFNRANIKGIHHVNLNMSLKYSEEFWRNLKGRIKSGKPTVFVNNGSLSDDLLIKTSKIIASHIGVKEGLISYDSRDLLELSIRKDDAVSVPAFPENRQFISPIEFYAIHQNSSYLDSSVICFTDGCIDTFGSIAIDADDNDLYSFNGTINTDVSSLDKSKRIFVAAEDQFSSIIASELAYKLSSEGYLFKGFIYESGLYMGDARINHKDKSITSTNRIFMLSQYFHEVKELVFSEREIEVSQGVGVLIFVLFGAMILSSMMAAKVIGLVGIAVGSSMLVYPIEVINSSSIPPSLCLLISLLICIATNKNKLLVASLSPFVFVFWSLGLFSFGASISILGFSIASLIMFAVTKLHRTRDNWEIKEGVKSALSRKYASRKMKGRIVRTANEAIKLMKPNKEYLLRSNIPCLEEMSMGGCYESHVINKGFTKEEIESLFTGASNEMYWLVPYIEFKKTGVIESVSSRRLSVMCALGEPEAVTSGKNAEVNFISRYAPSGGIEKDLVSALSEVEEDLGYPVHMEIGITRKNRVEILQVRPMSQFSIENWQLSKINWVKVDNAKGSELGERVLFSLTGGEIVMGKNGTFRRADKKPRKELSEIEKILFTEAPVFLMGYENGTDSIDGLVNIVSSRFSPLIALVSSGIVNDSVTLSQVMYEKLASEVFEFHKANGIINGYDIDSELMTMPINAEPPKISNDRDLLNLVMVALITWIRVRAEKSVFSQEANKALLGGKMKVIVPGCFDGNRVDLSDFITLSEDEKRDCVLLTTSIPVAMTSEALKAKAVIMTEGTEMSHFCLSAKSNQVACAIVK